MFTPGLSRMLERVEFNYNVSQFTILGPNGPGDVTVKLDTV
ncbi:hypothetical protein Pan153_04320 [Gimesia panareensis]|uniref:Uncharacterized protein n=1 Tax=Gimesia panareensis TaxID=2527978 RepID=A0A517Q0L8_9PLAN|nr:hypothetical protein Enr10x_04600 [Gimesia panareensis]QDU48130.1 hypothetical protein Pan110_04430 [Gimesia panareensis]QDV15813.1 hypothetical protein Pan153_04320 [Gimesia panareensis]